MGIGVGFIVLLAILLTLVKWGLIIWGIVWLVRYLRRGQEEKQRFRLELGKLADEVQLLRQELKGGKEQNSPAETE
jgi:biopolymer transport protein ExbB/TolQ